MDVGSRDDLEVCRLFHKLKDVDTKTVQFPVDQILNSFPDDLLDQQNRVDAVDLPDVLGKPSIMVDLEFLGHGELMGCHC